jgi:hypothetical protein
MLLAVLVVVTHGRNLSVINVTGKVISFKAAINWAVNAKSYIYNQVDNESPHWTVRKIIIKSMYPKVQIWIWNFIYSKRLYQKRACRKSGVKDQSNLPKKTKKGGRVYSPRVVA